VLVDTILLKIIFNAELAFVSQTTKFDHTCILSQHVRWFNFTREREDRRTFKPLKPNSTCIGLQTGRVVPAH